MTTKITIDAAEFVDRIEEQLAWIAVAGECSSEYSLSGSRDLRREVKRGKGVFFADHFRNAVPWVSLGSGDLAVLECEDGFSAEMGEKHQIGELTRQEKARLMRELTSKLQRPLRQAQVREGFIASGPRDGGYLLSSVAVLDRPWNGKSGPCRGMRQLWVQDIELASNLAPSLRSVQSESAFIRHDGLDIVSSSGRPVDDSWLTTVIVAAADQASAEAHWLVELSLSKERTGLAIQTDAIGARDLLASLGRAPSRRALVHWVKAHYRRRRGKGEPALVRAHLRGTQLAIAGNLYATVRPSVVDIDAACNGQRFDEREAAAE